MDLNIRLMIPAVALLLTGCPGPNPLLDEQDGALSPRGDSALCLPENSGAISLETLTLTAGVAAQYRVNPPGTLAAVDVTGQLVDHRLEWDFSSTAGSVVEARVHPVGEFWFAPHFPGASFAVDAALGGDTLQIFRVDQERLLLLGLASRAPEVTLMIYDSPITTLRFPLREGDSFVARSTVTNGKLNNLPVATEDTYEIEVDASGAARLPYLRLEHTLRIKSVVTSRALGGVSVTYRQYQWFAECYGEVARAVSQPGEPAPIFTEAAEFRRLSF